MPKTITLRLSDEIYEKFNRVAAEDNRSIANLIETLALRKLDEEILADDFEMHEIFSNAQLLKKLEKGHGDTMMKKAGWLGKFKIFETDQFFQDLSQDFRGQGKRIAKKLKITSVFNSGTTPILEKCQET